ncbi:MAG: hypothetical protein [Arlivirus sp. XZN142933]|nr:MAG: hypothetical protein [Arlivirus sp. XZN142933]
MSKSEDLSDIIKNKKRTSQKKRSVATVEDKKHGPIDVPTSSNSNTRQLREETPLKSLVKTNKTKESEALNQFLNSEMMEDFINTASNNYPLAQALSTITSVNNDSILSTIIEDKIDPNNEMLGNIEKTEVFKTLLRNAPDNTMEAITTQTIAPQLSLNPPTDEGEIDELEQKMNDLGEGLKEQRDALNQQLEIMIDKSQDNKTESEFHLTEDNTINKTTNDAIINLNKNHDNQQVSDLTLNKLVVKAQVENISKHFLNQQEESFTHKIDEGHRKTEHEKQVKPSAFLFSETLLGETKQNSEEEMIKRSTFNKNTVLDSCRSVNSEKEITPELVDTYSVGSIDNQFEVLSNDSDDDSNHSCTNSNYDIGTHLLKTLSQNLEYYAGIIKKVRNCELEDTINPDIINVGLYLAATEMSDRFLELNKIILEQDEKIEKLNNELAEKTESMQVLEGRIESLTSKLESYDKIIGHLSENQEAIQVSKYISQPLPQQKQIKSAISEIQKNTKISDDPKTKTDFSALHRALINKTKQPTSVSKKALPNAEMTKNVGLDKKKQTKKEKMRLCVSEIWHQLQDLGDELYERANDKTYIQLLSMRIARKLNVSLTIVEETVKEYLNPTDDNE